MVEISIRDDALVVDVLGSHKLFALKSQLTVPLQHAKGARHPENAITIERKDEELAETIVEAEDPEAMGTIIHDAVRTMSGRRGPHLAQRAALTHTLPR